MRLNIITWNINFIHDNWLERLNNINKILEKEVDDTHIIALQEATLPFSNEIKELHTFLNKKNIKYFDTYLLERNFIYKYLCSTFPKYKKYLLGVFDYLMNKYMWICGYIFSHWGHYFKLLYFKYKYILLLICFFFFPLLLSVWYFFGLLTIVSCKIKTQVKSKYFCNRVIQYFDFTYNNKEIRCVNLHLCPGKKKKDKKKRLDTIKNIIKFCKNKPNVILLGDFNDKKKSNMYKYMIKKGFKNSVYNLLGKELYTYPSNKPKKCIDFIMIKGDINIKNAITFGDINASDHKGIKVTLDI